MKKPPVFVVALALSSVLLTQALVPAAAGACSIRISLWDQVQQAELIVLARVESVDPHVELGEYTGSTYPDMSEPTTVLRVIDTWKGPLVREIEVTLGYRGLAPGDVVVAFLEQGETRARREREGREMAAAELAEETEAEDEAAGENVETWSAEARAAAEAEQLEEFRRFEEWSRHRWLPVEFFPADGGSDESEALHDLVERAVRLQGAGPVRPADRFDWFVSAAERRDTRSHGLFALPMPRAEAPEFLETEEEMTDAHRARLAAGFVGEPSVDFMDLQMLRVLASYPDSDVDLAAASLVEAGLLLKPIPEWVVDLVAETLRRYGDDFGDRIGRVELDERGRPVPVGAGEDTLPGIWRQARRELGIPETAPASAAAGPVLR